MDPSQPASAPPMAWKSSEGQSAPPPPYYGAAYPGLAQPSSGYPGQPGFGASPQYGVGYDQQPYHPGQQFSGPPGIVTVHPVGGQGPLAVPVNDYLGYSIFTMLCCCLPLGIAALVHSISVREANSRGDQLAAERYSTTARTLNHVALGLGLLALVASITLVAITFSSY